MTRDSDSGPAGPGIIKFRILAGIRVIESSPTHWQADCHSGSDADSHGLRLASAAPAAPPGLACLGPARGTVTDSLTTRVSLRLPVPGHGVANLMLVPRTPPESLR